MVRQVVQENLNTKRNMDRYILERAQGSLRGSLLFVWVEVEGGFPGSKNMARNDRLGREIYYTEIEELNVSVVE